MLKEPHQFKELKVMLVKQVILGHKELQDISEPKVEQEIQEL